MAISIDQSFVWLHVLNVRPGDSLIAVHIITGLGFFVAFGHVTIVPVPVTDISLGVRIYDMKSATGCSKDRVGTGTCRVG